MKSTEIIYKCRSVNNKNVRANELAILEKHPEELYFIIGADNINTKKRYYNDLKTLNEDYEELVKMKEKMAKKEEAKNDLEPENYFNEPNAKPRYSPRKIEE